MAELFERNPPSREISSFLRRKKLDYLSQTESTATMHSISRFYYEVETAVGMLEKKYVGQSRNKEIQQLVGTQRMVINALKKIHTKIVSRLRPTPNLTNPWNGEFSLDIPREVFDVLLKHIVQRNSYGHQYTESIAARFLLKIHRCVKYVSTLILLTSIGKSFSHRPRILSIDPLRDARIST